MFYIFILNILLFTTKSYIFSVIVSIYNTARYLNDSINSLLIQSIGFKTIQLILVNDGSFDNSEQICLKYQNLYPDNIYYIKINNSGVSKARNVGLKYIKGLYINFLDSDDKWDSNALKNAFLFFKYFKNVYIVSGRIKYFEASNNYHFFFFIFKTTRVIDLNKEFHCIQLHVSSSFFKKNVINNNKFDEKIFVGEDVKFLFNILISKPLLGLLKESIYFYRKRSDSTSAIQNTEKNINFYLSRHNLVQQELINKSNLLYKKIIPFIQFYISYELMFRIASPSYKILDLVNYKIYCQLTENLLNQIEDIYILEQKVSSTKLKIFVLSKKHNRDIRYDMQLINQQLLYSNHIIIDFKEKNYLIVWKNLEIINNILHLEGEDKFWMPRENYYYYCQLENKTIFPSYFDHSEYDYLTLYGKYIKGRVVVFDINLENVEESIILKFCISYLNNNFEI